LTDCQRCRPRCRRDESAAPKTSSRTSVFTNHERSARHIWSGAGLLLRVGRLEQKRLLSAAQAFAPRHPTPHGYPACAAPPKKGAAVTESRAAAQPGPSSQAPSQPQRGLSGLDLTDHDHLAHHTHNPIPELSTNDKPLTSTTSRSGKVPITGSTRSSTHDTLMMSSSPTRFKPATHPRPSSNQTEGENQHLPQPSSLGRRVGHPRRSLRTTFCTSPIRPARSARNDCKTTSAAANSITESMPKATLIDATRTG